MSLKPHHASNDPMKDPTPKATQSESANNIAAKRQNAAFNIFYHIQSLIRTFGNATMNADLTSAQHDWVNMVITERRNSHRLQVIFYYDWFLNEPSVFGKANQQERDDFQGFCEWYIELTNYSMPLTTEMEYVMRRYLSNASLLSRKDFLQRLNSTEPSTFILEKV